MTESIEKSRGAEPFGSFLRNVLLERQARLNGQGKVRARCLLGYTRLVSLGCSQELYRFFCRFQLKRTCLNKWKLRYEGLENIDKSKPSLFVMKHRSFSDITLHGFAYAWASSGLYLENPEPWNKPEQLIDILNAGKTSRFVMKEDLLDLPIGLHLVLNGGIPVPQDLETKALNQPGFDPKDPKVLAQQKKLSSWFNFKDSYREILTTLKSNGSLMIYGEATRVDGDRMGHLSLKMIERLCGVPQTQLIPVGSRVEAGTMIVSYGAPCQIADLRDQIANLSGIPPEGYLP